MKLSLRLVVVEFLAFLAFLLLAGVGLLAWRLSQGAIDLEFIRPQIERSLTDARGGRPVRIETLGLEWIRDRGRVEAVARGFVAMDDQNGEAFRAERALISLDAGALLALQLRTRQLRLEDGRATVVRSKEGLWTLADVEIAREPDASDKPFDPVRDINWATLATPIRALIEAGSFEQVELTNFHLTVLDQKTGTAWGAEPVEGQWKANRDGVSLELNVRLAGAQAGQPNAVRIALLSDGDVERASGRLTLDGVDPMSIAAMFGYTGDAFAASRPASATFTITATERSGLLNTQLSLRDVAGSVKIAEEAIAVRDLSFTAIYDPATRFITLEGLNVDSDAVTGAFTGALDARSLMAGDTSTPSAFALSSETFTLAVPYVFARPVEIRSFDVEGDITPDLRRIGLSLIKAGSGDMLATGNGEVWLEGQGDLLAVGVRGRASSEGTLTPQQVVDFWPDLADAYARSWVKDNIPSARVSNVVFEVDWPPGAADKGFLPDENLSLSFDVADATVKFLPDFPPATGVSGKGRLRGNSIVLDADGGELKSWDIDQARITFPRFAPEGATASISVAGRGPLGELLQVVDDSRFDVTSRYGVQTGQVAGQGGVALQISYPMTLTVAEEDVVYSIKGAFSDVGAPNIAGDFGLTEGGVSFELANAGFSANGQGRFGPTPVSFEWREEVRDGASRSELVAKARATADLLNAFGLAVRNVMQGEAELELRASGPGGRNFDRVVASVDLQNADIELPEFGWRKPLNAPARGRVRYETQASGSSVAADIRSDGIELIAEAQLDPDGVLRGVDIDRLFSRESVDISGRVRRKGDGGYRAILRGPFFDASPWMDTLLDMSDQGAPGVGAGGRRNNGPVHEIELSADRLRVRPDAQISDVRMSLTVDDEGPLQGSLRGQIAPDKFVSVALNAEGETGKIALRADDAGFAARVLLKADYLVGGKLAIDGTFTGSVGDASVKMTDVRLKDAPLLAQIFSLASLQGLADVLSGEGVLFSEIDAPIRFVDGRIDAPGMRASGPAMGITARGWIAPETSELSLDGVLVPSYGMNSLLGGLPVIGDLFVSRQGEGMFAPTYSVRGTFARARVSINPVAAFTPGVLRRIFENPTAPPPAPDASLPAPPTPSGGP